MAWTLMELMGTSRRIVETWLYIEVMLVLGTGILGLGHHYFWIGTPQYWLSIGGFFSALEPLPLLGMVVHAVYDAGTHHMTAEDDELIAAEAGEQDLLRVGLIRRDRLHQPLCNDAQHRVANCVAEGIVDALEAIQIEINERNGFILVRRTGYPISRRIETALAIWQTGERVVKGKPLDSLGLGHLSLSSTERVAEEPEPRCEISSAGRSRRPYRRALMDRQPQG